ncbi:xanthine/uracil permease family protein [Nitzschia inconspicua]|uniref:Xanthine/uracil permease family protein n=1 Tax=Nitzschia inconspicua TaxID=303405 RepID=A0A9K3PKE7_9STRA|nr:xanthine/uracil permease family protein [Nitzschia inconspicua]
MGPIDKVDEWFAGTRIAKFFEMNERGTTLFTELGGALVTFMTMAYILAVNPRILADSGGPCVPDPQEEGGIFGPNYEDCLERLKREYITATAIGSCVGCVIMGLLANLPIALAPGMGMNAYFTYSVVGFRGTGTVAWDSAVTAIMIEGAIFLVLAVSGARSFLARLIPEPVRLATPAAIGAFLAHLGLQTAEGIGIVVSDIATAVTLGACPEDKRTPIVAFTEACRADSSSCVTSDAYTCDDLGGVMTSGTTWMGLLGMMITLIFMAYKWRSAMIIGIAFVTIVSWFRNTAVTYFPDTPAGDARFEYFSQVVAFENMDMLIAPFTSDLKSAGVALITFLYVDFLDTSGTLMGIVSNMGFTDEHGDFPKSRQAFSVDAISTMFGSIFGLSPVTSYIESAGGVGAGARTGLTALFVGFFFFLSLFFAPIIASIPPWATGGALILVGSMMARSLKDVKWYDITHAATAFITVITMPLTYSIAYGLIAGIVIWIILQTVFWILGFLGIERPEFTEDDIPKGAVKSDDDKGVDEKDNSEEQVEEAADANDSPKEKDMEA